MLKVKMISTLIGVLLSFLTPELLKRVVNMLLDEIEKIVKDSANTVDDIAILPIVDLIRRTFDVPVEADPVAK